MERTIPGSRPLRRDAELNRQRVMAAAREVFADRGLEATLDDIAHHAGLGVATVYRRFPNKPALIDALFEESFEHVVELTESAAAAADPWAGFVGWITEIITLQAKDRGFGELLLSDEYGRDRIAQLRDRLKPPLDHLIERAQQEGPLRRDIGGGDVPLMQLMLAVIAEFTRTAASPDVWRRYLQILLDGLVERRAEPSALPVPMLNDDEVARAMQTWPPTRRS